MNLEFSDELRAFQMEVRGFIEANLPDDLRRKVEQGLNLYKEDYVRWQKILADKGWAGAGWPTEYGGPGWDAVRQYIFQEELGRANSPRLISFGLKMVGPVIYTYGTQAQKDFYLPRILDCTDWWCQGYSEPGAGSDLASLQTRAVLEGDNYVVNGTKTWTTQAQYADRMFCLARTDPDAPKKQLGISFLLIDMDQPGIEVQPIVTMDGGREINTVFLSDVKVPVEDRVGEENEGWTYAKFLLANERTGIARIAITKARLAVLKEIARNHVQGGRTVMEDPDFAQGIAEAEIELTALEFTELRYLIQAEGGTPGAEASMLKLRGTDLQQKVAELLMKAVGPYAMPFVPEALDYGSNVEPVGPDYAASLAPTYFNQRKASIYGGSNEIQRGIMAKMVLGL